MRRDPSTSWWPARDACRCRALRRRLPAACRRADIDLAARRQRLYFSAARRCSAPGNTEAVREGNEKESTAPVVSAGRYVRSCLFFVLVFFFLLRLARIRRMNCCGQSIPDALVASKPPHFIVCVHFFS